MSDKRKAIVQIFTQGPPENINEEIETGYTTKLIFRKQTDQFNVFDSISGLSQMVGPLHDQLKQVELTRLERKFFNPSVKEYEFLFHRPLKACLLSDDQQLNQHALQFGITIVNSFEETEKFDITFTVDKPLAISKSKYRLLCFPSGKINQHENEFELRPVQSYERFGPLKIENFSDEGFYCVETDEMFQRVDIHKSLESISTVSEIQLADSLIRAVGFKLGAFDKFGA